VLADFHSIYFHGFIRGAVCLPHMRVPDSVFNTKRTLALAKRATDPDPALALFQELGVSGYSNEDLFHQDVLLDATRMAVARIVKASVDLSPVLFIGAPLCFEGKLFNWAVVIYRGKILRIVPKTYLPSYREFYEKRQFNSGRNAVRTEQLFLGRVVPFGNDLVFEANSVSDSLLHVEVCEDLCLYDLQDFNLYYITRFGFRPSKVAFLCQYAGSYKSRGTWPDHLAADKHREYDLPAIKKWLEIFVSRFFQLSQFKRSCLPNGPKMSSGSSLSLRGDWRAPSDAEAIACLDEVRSQIP